MSITQSLTRALTQPLTRPLTSPGAGGGAAPTLTDDLAAIFAATSAKGYMLRLDSAATLRQNSGGTGAVSSVSDPVGYATDLSGNGNHFTQATSGNRALWNGTGCDFDGVNDGLTRAALDLAGRSYVYLAFAGQKNTGAVNGPIMYHGSPIASTDGAVGIAANGAAIIAYQYQARGVTSQAQTRITASDDVMGSLVAYWNMTVGTSVDTQLDVWHDGVAQAVPVGANTPIGALTTQTHYIGSNAATQHFASKGRRYAVLATTSPLTTPQLTTLIA